MVNPNAGARAIPAQPNPGTVAPRSNPRPGVGPGNAWAEPGRAGQPGRYYTGTPRPPGQNRNEHRARAGNTYISQYYGGYYPVYVDVPVPVYVDAGVADSGDYSQGAPAPAPAAGSDGGSDVIAPSTLTVTPETPAASPAPSAMASPDATAAGSPAPNPETGPDSLVEAVQGELARRGYFQGKVDAMFRADTEVALRRFQQDNYLAPTGHLNEPTLHALNLD